MAVDTRCECDEGYACSFPPCVAERKETEERMRALYEATVPMSREEWEAVYEDDLGKRASYDRLVVEQPALPTPPPLA